MKAIQIIDKGVAQVIEQEKPTIKPGHVLLKIHYVGFCGSDLNTFRGLNPLVKMPIIPGHEIGAQVLEVGEGVPGVIAPGVHCTVNPYTNCGHCAACASGHPNACEYNETLGVQRQGAMADFLLVPWQKVIADNEITPRDFALVEPMSVGFHAVNRAQVTDSDTVMVFGCGMIGVGAIVRASLRGARVIAVDIDDEKLALAQQLGAHYTINSMNESLHERLQSITLGEGPNVVIEAVGRPETYVAAINEVAFSGRVVCIGYAKQDIAFNTSYFVKKEMTIRGSRNAMPSDFKAVMEYLKRGTCPLDRLISDIVVPEKAQEALEGWMANPGKIFRILVKF